VFRYNIRFAEFVVRVSLLYLPSNPYKISLGGESNLFFFTPVSIFAKLTNLSESREKNEYQPL